MRTCEDIAGLLGESREEMSTEALILMWIYDRTPFLWGLN